MGNEEQPTRLLGGRLKRGDEARFSLRLGEVEGLLGRGSGGGQEKRVVASAVVAEQLAADERVGDEGDAAAAVPAVGAAEDVYGERALEEVCPGAAA